MKKMSVLIGLVMALAIAVLPVSAIFNGNLDTAHSNVGAIVMYWPQFGTTGRLITAALITQRVLVTAAHCTPYIAAQGIQLDEVWVTFEQDANFGDPNTDGRYLDVENIIVHPDWNEDFPDYFNDIALVILVNPVSEDIVPKQRPIVGYMDDVVQKLKGKDKLTMQMNVVGYGTSGVLRAGEIQLDAIRRYGTVTFDKLQSLIIITYQDDSLDNARTYLGDSGGPLFHVDQQGNEILVGLLSKSSAQSWSEN